MQNLVSRSCSRYLLLARNPHFCIVTLRPICSIHCWSGWGVIPARQTLRLSNWIKNNTLSFAKNRSHRFSGCTTHATSQSSSSISGSSQRSTSIEWCWKSNQWQKTSNPRSRGQDCSSRNQPANCATKISSHNSSKTCLLYTSDAAHYG